MNGLVSDYAQLRTIPALLSVLFAVCSAYQFGGLSQPTLIWLDYTLTQGHAMLLGIGIFAVAFASSETKQFANYRPGEKVIIVAGFVLMFGQQHIGFIADTLANNQPAGGIVAFLITMLAWGVAVR